MGWESKQCIWIIVSGPLELGDSVCKDWGDQRDEMGKAGQRMGRRRSRKGRWVSGGKD